MVDMIQVPCVIFDRGYVIATLLLDTYYMMHHTCYMEHKEIII